MLVMVVERFTRMGVPGAGPCGAILVHGMSRTPASMLWLALRLRRVGVRGHLFGYAAAFEPFERIVTRLARRLERVAQGPYVAVGHSLGGLLLSAALDRLPPGVRRPERLFLLGTPMRAPRVAQRFSRRLVYRLFNGDCGQRLADASWMAARPRPRVPVTVLAGTRSRRWPANAFGAEENDGTVAVSEVALEGAPLIRLPVGHTFMMNSRHVFDVIAAALPGGGARR